MNKIERIKLKANDKKELMKIKNDIEIEKINLDNEVLNSQTRHLETKYNNMLLQNKNSLFARLKLSGLILSLLSIFSFIVSTILSLLSGYNIIKNVGLFVGFALIMIVCQLIIFISSKYSNLVKDKFIDNYVGLKLMQISLLIVSLTLNVMFMHECFKSVLLDIILFPLCFILDYSTIYFVNLGYRMKTINFTTGTDKKKITILDMIVDNITYGLRTKIIETYNKNNVVKDIVDDSVKDITVKDILVKPIDTKEIEAVKDIENIEIVKDIVNDKVKDKPVKDIIKSPKVDDNKFKPSELNIKDIKEYILNKYSDNDYINIKDLANEFNLSEYKLKRVKECLKEENIIFTDKKKSYLKPQNKISRIK